MQKRFFLHTLALAVLGAGMATSAVAQDNKFKVGMVLTMTVPFAPVATQASPYVLRTSFTVAQAAIWKSSMNAQPAI